MPSVTRTLDPTVANGILDVAAVVVTPTMAAEWLESTNVHNRKMSARVVSAYASDMREGEWIDNAETIKFSRTGALLDGQHRLAAVVEADVPVQFLVARGLDPAAQDTVDNGRKRTFADVLTLRGEKDAVQLAAIVRAVTLADGTASYVTDKRGSPTNAQLTRTLDAYPELRDIATKARHVSKNAEIPASVAGFAYWAFSRLDAEDAAYFFARIASDTGHAEGEPAYEFRRAAAALARGNARSRVDNRYLMAILVKAWNAYRDGAKVGLLRWKPGGAKPERFPEAR